METSETNNEVFKQLAAVVEQVKSEFGKIIIGQQETIELMLAALIADGHVLLEGVPGVAKTSLAKLLARTVNVGFSRIQFTPDLMPSDVIGTSIYNQKTAEFTFRKGPVFSDIVLIDEINRAPAKTQASLFEVMQERQISFDGVTYPASTVFMVLATQNPVEHEGTYRLPEAEIDRFLFKITVPYPSPEEEVLMLVKLHERENLNDFSMVQPVLNQEQLLQYRKLVKSIYVKQETAEYIVKIIQATRNSKDVFLGASPRAALALLQAAKARAAMQGRGFVTPDDISDIVAPVLKHRLILAAEKEMEGVTVEQVLTEMISTIEVPR